MPAPIRAVQDLVARMRANRVAWDVATYRPTRSPTDEQIDLGSYDRAAALVGFGYDRNEADLGLCRFLLEQEVKCHEDFELRGLEGDLRLACALVAGAREPEDIWMLARAKLAKPDEIDRELLYAAGVDKTAAYVRASHHDDRERVLDELYDDVGERWFTESQLATWWEAMAKQFPARPESDHPLFVAATALRFGTREEALPWLERWTRGERADADEQSWAKELAGELALDEALRARVEALKL